jgi:acetate kinase
MGLTPVGGIVMSTRAGDLDPGVVIHLLRHGADGSGPLDADGLEQLVNRRSGLLGLSGETADMHALLEARASGDDRAALAVDVFCRTVAKRIGALAVPLGGIDSLVFTGGIGEHEAQVRAEVCAPLGFLGIALDPDVNAATGSEMATISPPTSGVDVLVVPADEARIMAREAFDTVHASGGSPLT